MRAGIDAVQALPHEADALGLGRRGDVAELRGDGVAGAAAAHQVHLHGLRAAAQVHAVEAAKARPLLGGQAVEHLGGDQRFVVAGVVEQPRGHVDGVAEAVTAHLDDLAARERHLQP